MKILKSVKDFKEFRSKLSATAQVTQPLQATQVTQSTQSGVQAAQVTQSAQSGIQSAQATQSAQPVQGVKGVQAAHRSGGFSSGFSSGLSPGFSSGFSLGFSLGFVPTMGALHRGHGDLIKKSTDENDYTVVSVFVNPTQFNDKKDFETYPNTWREDLSLCEELGVDVVFSPSVDEMHLQEDSIVLSERKISKDFEGQHRPGHFDGVMMILLKLLGVVRPSYIYMGEKDYQQALLTIQLCKQFFLDTQVKVVETLRDESGLPLSSRNLNLTAKGFSKAQKIARKFHSSRNKEEFLSELEEISLDYFGKLEFGELESKILMAHRIEGIRILDNKDVDE